MFCKLYLDLFEIVDLYFLFLFSKIDSVIKNGNFFIVLALESLQKQDHHYNKPFFFVSVKTSQALHVVYVSHCETWKWASSNNTNRLNLKTWSISITCSLLYKTYIWFYADIWFVHFDGIFLLILEGFVGHYFHSGLASFGRLYTQNVPFSGTLDYFTLYVNYCKSKLFLCLIFYE